MFCENSISFTTNFTILFFFPVSYKVSCCQFCVVMFALLPKLSFLVFYFLRSDSAILQLSKIKLPRIALQDSSQRDLMKPVTVDQSFPPALPTHSCSTIHGMAEKDREGSKLSKTVAEV